MKREGLQFQATSSPVPLLTILSARPLTDVQDSDTGQEVREGGRAGAYIRRRACSGEGAGCSGEGAGLSAKCAAAQLTGGRKLRLPFLSFFSREREESLSPLGPFYIFFFFFI